MAGAETNNLAPSLKERLFLDAGRVEAMAVAIEEIAGLKEPVERVLDGLDNRRWTEDREGFCPHWCDRDHL